MKEYRIIGGSPGAKINACASLLRSQSSRSREKKRKRRCNFTILGEDGQKLEVLVECTSINREEQPAGVYPRVRYSMKGRIVRFGSQGVERGSRVEVVAYSPLGERAVEGKLKAATELFPVLTPELV